MERINKKWIEGVKVVGGKKVVVVILNLLIEMRMG
jgi:hypothetical protein